MADLVDGTHELWYVYSPRIGESGHHMDVAKPIAALIDREAAYHFSRDYLRTELHRSGIVSPDSAVVNAGYVLHGAEWVPLAVIAETPQEALGLAALRALQRANDMGGDLEQLCRDLTDDALREGLGLADMEQFAHLLGESSDREIVSV